MSHAEQQLFFVGFSPTTSFSLVLQRFSTRMRPAVSAAPCWQPLSLCAEDYPWDDGPCQQRVEGEVFGLRDSTEGLSVQSHQSSDPEQPEQNQEQG